MHSFQIHIFQGLIEPQKSTFWAMTLLEISPNVRSDYTANLFATFCDSVNLCGSIMNRFNWEAVDWKVLYKYM